MKFQCPKWRINKQHQQFKTNHLHTVPCRSLLVVKVLLIVIDHRFDVDLRRWPVDVGSTRFYAITRGADDDA